jgi:BirA family transcriptional regulator, biotin operon repressor / biotin---[acetyl-CoA-carboxylase] ligase
VIATGAPVPAANRASLSATTLRSALVRQGALWRDVQVVTETGSSNADLLADARDGAQEGIVLAAESQTAGRGRLGRRWSSPPRAALTFSVLLRPGGVPPGRRGWVPLLAGVAVASALRAGAGVDARLKWPNDVLVQGAKVAGILAEQCGDAIVVGIGINVSTRQDELPADGATSLALAGAVCTDREYLLACVLTELERWYLTWINAGSRQDPPGQPPAGQPPAGQPPAGHDPARQGSPAPGDADASGLRAEYLRLSGTVGRAVRVSLPGGQVLTGTAKDVDEAGRLVIRTASGLVAVSAGDVGHLR